MSFGREWGEERRKGGGGVRMMTLLDAPGKE